MRTLRIARVAWGALLLMRGPGTVGRVLGARNIAQATLLHARPRANAAIDVTHAVSMLVLAALAPRHRRPALFSAVAASLWAYVGLHVA